MSKKVIHAISFLYNGERVVVKPTTFGKFRGPVVKGLNGSLKTEMKALTAMEVVKHDIIKNCDPTFYLEKGERMRVYPGADSSYLPAQSQGLAMKHDEANKVELPKLKSNRSSKTSSKFDYDQASIDMYGWHPGYDGYAD